MDAPNTLFVGIFVVVFIAAFVTSVISWFRILTAKNRKTYWTSIALFVAPILLVFALAELGGLMPESDFESEPLTEVPRIQEIFGLLPLMQKILLGAAGAVWIIGGNLLFVAHARRTNKKWWQVMNPLDPLFKDFNVREWSVLIGLLVVSLGLGVAAIAQNPPVH